MFYNKQRDEENDSSFIQHTPLTAISLNHVSIVAFIQSPHTAQVIISVTGQNRSALKSNPHPQKGTVWSRRAGERFDMLLCVSCELLSSSA